MSVLGRVLVKDLFMAAPTAVCYAASGGTGY